MTKTVLILGANGKIGSHCETAFTSDGWTVRKFDRNKDDLIKSAMGADVIINGLNPPNYHNWAGLLPQITRDVIAAAKTSGATVILPGNVYQFGAQSGIWDENTPHLPTTRKGKLRQELEQAYRNAALEGVQTINLRAGDFIASPGEETIMAKVMFTRLSRGKLTLMGSETAKHAWCYLPDYGRAAVALANMRMDLENYEDIPFPGQNIASNQLKDLLEQLLDRKLRTSVFPWWLMTLASPFWELARELTEMRYLWDLPHELSGEKFFGLLPDFQMTPSVTAIAATLPNNIHPNQTMVRTDRAIRAN